MVKRSGLCGKVFTILGNSKINVKLLAQGPSELNIIVGVSEADYEETIRSL
ncbi:MAG: hypothetical protein L6U99_11765 [Clostridium sp.]|nr:MAG: hypothetical protein L6U99_11765 [Clostridium sp.]